MEREFVPDCRELGLQPGLPAARQPTLRVSVRVALDEIGFITVNHIIWKYQFGVVTRRKFVTSHYHCLYVCKGDEKRKFFPYARFGKQSENELGRSLHYEDKEDVWVIKREYWHGDQKTPTKLLPNSSGRFSNIPATRGTRFSILSSARARWPLSPR